ncbi:hypothetical protein D0Z07_5369 [Hyphodiscus hymeniophilus]|uniref:Sulfatase N-terminal domain-containing protein n=1 Tax=Hyphodiscus hymeniophilus TaxID=353542 RepID=A0A9P6VHY5_9HELO|nr:hypothetical protein D0Z07_5369 [Hyphodiscus hymeniophilus]
MRSHIFRSVESRLRQSWTASFHYSLLVTATLLPKLLHFYTHITSLPYLLTVLYLLTFFALDVLNAASFWVLVHLNARGALSVLLGLCRTTFTTIIVGASSVQIAFYFETGGEIKWGAAGNFAHDPAGFKLLLSGGLQALLVSIFIIVVARVASDPLYHGMEMLVSKLKKTFSTPAAVRPSTEPKEQTYESTTADIGYSDSRLSIDNVNLLFGDLENLEVEVCTPKRVHNVSLRLYQLLFLAPVVITLILLAVRPPHFPYAHMSGSIPYTLFEMLSPYSQDMCQAGSSRDFIPFPFPDLIAPTFWEPPNGEFPGWMPNTNFSDVLKDQENMQLPSWLPLERVSGFDRWHHRSSQDRGRDSKEYYSEGMEGPVAERNRRYRRRHRHKHANYDPVQDPMRISNLDGDIFPSIVNVLKENKVTIKHVVILSLESTRKDVFPLKKESHLHDLIMKTHGSADTAAKVSSQLAALTPNAEILTGESDGFDYLEEDSPSGIKTWRKLSQSKGGLNIVGAVTGSSSTFKSMLGSHCGVQPLPVDFTVEAGSPIYQPCLPSILHLFNLNKTSSSMERQSSMDQDLDVASRPWKSVFVQSITDQYDRQDELNRRIAFDEVVSKETILDPMSKHPSTEPEVNYFGFPESQVKPYLLDIFQSAKMNNERLFLSHFTSTTHHPWGIPKAAMETVDYLKKGKWRSEHALNKYINTIKYQDNWIGEVMDMLDQFDMAEETLVVMVGDHGYAFEEDSNMHSTFENGHITNFRVPLLFHHPSLPRIQLAINATSLSILPTILDLLIATSSLNTQDLEIASNLIHQYEGQSLIRPFIPQRLGRQQWNIGVLNAGGALLAVSSAAFPFRLVIPICKPGVYRFTDTSRDPNEVSAVEGNSISALAKTLRRKFGNEEAVWVSEAEKIGKWWVLEQRRRWAYDGAALQDDRRPDEMKGVGKTRGKHWWET